MPPTNARPTAPVDNQTLHIAGMARDSEYFDFTDIPPRQLTASPSGMNRNLVYADQAGRSAFEEATDHTNYVRRFYRGIIP